MESQNIRHNNEDALARRFALVYLLSATPLSLFLYVNTFQDAWTFFAGHSESWLIRFPFLFFAAAVWLGAGLLLALRLPGRIWITTGWLVLGGAVAVLLAQDPYRWGKWAAFTLCGPGWIASVCWLPRLWRESRQPSGEIRLWLFACVLLITAIVMSSVGHALYNLWFVPNLHFTLADKMYLLARVAGTALVLGLPGCLLLAALGLLLRRSAYGSRILLLALAITLGFIFVGILVFGIWRVDTRYLRPIHFVYATALVVPIILLFCRRMVAAGPALAHGLVQFGRGQTMSANVFGPGVADWRRALPWICLIAFVAAQLFIGRLQLYYGWGAATAFLYSGLALAWTWYLLTHLSRRAQMRLSGATLAMAGAGLILLIPARENSTAWSSYLKFDQNLGALVELFRNRYPRTEPELARVRERILASGLESIGLDLRTLHVQELTLRETARRPNVIFIVVDALRQDAYGGSPAHREKFPGVAWMSSRFVIYDNTWTSYNSTAGAYPAYLNGILHPAWYRITAADEVRHDNLLARACALANYTCYDFSGFMPEFGHVWPQSAKVAVPKEGVGMGDPAVIFPLALKTLEQHSVSSADQPAFLYLHLYNLHQPLLRRPGVPFDGRGRHWMRALYEHNTLYFDQHLLAFLQDLEQKGILKESLVVITSDHGEEFFDFGGLYHGWHINPPVMQVPLFVHYPRHQPGAPPPGTLSLRPANIIDIAPTICEAMGVAIHRETSLQGISLLSSDENEERSFPLFGWCNPLIGQISFSPPQMLVLNPITGAVDLFQPGKNGWEIQRQSASPLPLARQLGEELDRLFSFWNTRPAQPTELTSAEREIPTELLESPREN